MQNSLSWTALCRQSLKPLTHIAVTTKIRPSWFVIFSQTLRLHRFKVNHDVMMVIQALSLPSLSEHRSVIRRYRKRGVKLIRRVSFHFGVSEIFILLESSVTSRMGRNQPSVSFPLFETDRRSGYVFVSIWVSLGTFIYFVCFANFFTHRRLYSDCLWYILDGGFGSWGLGGVSVSCYLDFDSVGWKTNTDWCSF